MSKYIQKGCYHFQEFANPNTTYAKHVDDLLKQLKMHIGVGIQLSAYEVGCGEGLILEQIRQRLGWHCMGSEVDEVAVGIARRLNPNIVFNNTNRPPSDVLRDVALFCDSLEHVDKPEEFLEWAKGAKWIVIAVPDRHDPHGERDFAPDSFDPILSEWGTCVHRATRHARHLTIWRRNA